MSMKSVRLKAAAFALAAATCVTAPPALAQKGAASRATVTVNFVNADIEAVTRAFAAMINRNIIVDPRVKGQITVYSEQPQTVTEAYQGYLTALRGLGFAVVDSAGLLKVVPEADAKLQAGTVVVGAPTVRGDQVLTQMTSPKETPGEARSTEPVRTSKIGRPRELAGYTWQIPFDGQNLYVTVNHDGVDILEVFGAGPLSPSVGMLASKMLRGGFTSDEVVSCLNKINGTHSTFFNQRLITSPEQAVAECLRITQRRLQGLGDAAPKGIDMAVKSSHRACPECGSSNVFRNGGCDTCRDCSWSKCS